MSGQPRTFLATHPSISAALHHYWSTQVPGRWASGNSDRRRMALGAASHRPALRRPRHIGRSSVYRSKGGAQLQPWCWSSTKDSTASPPPPPHTQTGTGLEKVAQTKLAPSNPAIAPLLINQSPVAMGPVVTANPASIPQLAGHPIMRPKTSQVSMKVCHAVWSKEHEDMHGQQQAGANDSHHRP